MSEILIKNMALPKQGWKRLILLPDGEVREICGDEAVRATDARAVEIPPHGKLIDADLAEEVMKEVGKIHTSLLQRSMIEVAINTLKSAPIILEASEVEND